MVHLNRGVNVLDERGRAVVGKFADRFAGRVAGLVVHDKHEMAAQTDRLLRAMRDLDAHLRERPGGPMVFLEYAAGLEPAWFVEVAERPRRHQAGVCEVRAQPPWPEPREPWPAGRPAA
jgi:hypothetical protein